METIQVTSTLYAREHTTLCYMTQSNSPDHGRRGGGGGGRGEGVGTPKPQLSTQSKAQGEDHRATHSSRYPKTRKEAITCELFTSREQRHNLRERRCVETLGISTRKEEITINVANDRKVRRMAATLEIGTESVDGRVDTTIVVKTSNKICGGMRPTDRVTMKQLWNHLKVIPFPNLAQMGVIDVLLGSDYHHLMFSMPEIRGQEDEPAAKLCPLGWTAIERIGQSK